VTRPASCCLCRSASDLCPALHAGRTSRSARSGCRSTYGQDAGRHSDGVQVGFHRPAQRTVFIPAAGMKSPLLPPEQREVVPASPGVVLKPETWRTKHFPQTLSVRFLTLYLQDALRHASPRALAVSIVTRKPAWISGSRTSCSPSRAEARRPPPAAT